MRKCSVLRRKPVMDAVKGRIDDLLSDWSRRTTLKQRVTGPRARTSGDMPAVPAFYAYCRLKAAGW